VRSAAAPDFENGISEREDDGTENQARRAEDRQAADDGGEDGNRMEAHPFSNEHRVGKMVDRQTKKPGPL